MATMKKLVLLLSVVVVSFALQAGDSTCPKDKAACDKSKAAACDKAKAGNCDKAARCDKAKAAACDKAKGEAKGCCPAAKEAAKKPAPSPKA